LAPLDAHAGFNVIAHSFVVHLIISKLSFVVAMSGILTMIHTDSMKQSGDTPSLATIEGLSNSNKVLPSTVGKILMCFGIIILLCTKIEFRSQSSLCWSTTAALSKYIPATTFFQQV
jgi:hypothetical protein